MPSSCLIKKILTPLHRGDWAHSKYVSICAYCCRFGAQSRWKVTLAAMVFSDDVQLNPDLSINKNGKVRKRKRIEIRRVDKEEEDWMKINLKQAHSLGWTRWWRLDKSLNFSQKVLGSILIRNYCFWLRGIFQRKNECDFQDSNSEPCEQKASMLPQDHSYSWTWRIIWLCYSKIAARSSPKLFLSFSLQTLAVDWSALLCQ